MAAMTKLSSIYRTVVPRRTFTTRIVLRATPPGKPNDSMPFLQNKPISKLSFTLAFMMYVMTGFTWPVMAIRDQCIRIGAAVEDPAE